MANKQAKGKRKARQAVAPANGETISFRVEARKAQRAKAMAEREGLTLTQIMRVMLDAYLAGRFRVELTGALVAPETPKSTESEVYAPFFSSSASGVKKKRPKLWINRPEALLEDLQHAEASALDDLVHDESKGDNDE